MNSRNLTPRHLNNCEEVYGDLGQIEQVDKDTVSAILDICSDVVTPALERPHLLKELEEVRGELHGFEPVARDLLECHIGRRRVILHRSIKRKLEALGGKRVAVALIRGNPQVRTIGEVKHSLAGEI